MESLKVVLESALAESAAEIAASYSELARGSMLQLQGLYPAGKEIGIWDSSYSRWKNFVGPLSQPMPEFAPASQYMMDDSWDRPSQRMMNEAKLARASAEYAKIALAECINKMVAKLGSLESAEVVNFQGFSYFVVVGKINGHVVQIEQQSIINVSVKGKPFNQYPARLYVDGSFVSAAKLAAAVAA